MARFRDIKHKIKQTNKQTVNQVDDTKGLIVLRLKAFITDMFMVMMPILYITTYIILDGKDDFLHNDFARFSGAFLFGAVIIFMWYRLGQTPGMRAYGIKLIAINNKKLSFISVFLDIYYLY